MPLTRRRFWTTALSLGAAAALPRAVRSADEQESATGTPWVTPDGRIKIGLLWSLTGVMSVIEKSSRDVAMFWVEQVNREGGVAGMEVAPVEVDAMSDMGPYRDGVVELIDRERVLAVFGGYTSISRRAVMPLVTLRNHLFYYPTVYEGREMLSEVDLSEQVLSGYVSELLDRLNDIKARSVEYSREEQERAETWTILIAVLTIMVGISIIFLSHTENVRFHPIRHKYL